MNTVQGYIECNIHTTCKDIGHPLLRRADAGAEHARYVLGMQLEH